MNHPATPAKSRQQGAALLVALVILLIMTLLGVTTLQTTSLDEKMAGNSWDQNSAFQAAEAALRDAENQLASIVNTSNYTATGGTSSNGLYALGGSPTNPFASANWTGTNSLAYGSSTGKTALPNVGAQPRYYIEARGTIGETNISGIMAAGSGYGQSSGAGTVYGFRIVTRGIGRNAAGNTQVFLEEYFGKRL